MPPRVHWERRGAVTPPYALALRNGNKIVIAVRQKLLQDCGMAIKRGECRAIQITARFGGRALHHRRYGTASHWGL